jgi:hypothetical protein
MRDKTFSHAALGIWEKIVIDAHNLRLERIKMRPTLERLAYRDGFGIVGVSKFGPQFTLELFDE